MKSHTTTSTSTSTSTPKWKLEYDVILQQYYYINLQDNSISFDSPCEVMNHKKSTTNKKLFSSFKKHNSNNEYNMNCPISRSLSSSQPTQTQTQSNKPKSFYRRLSDALSLKSTKSNESDENIMLPNNSPRSSIASSFSSTMVDDTTIMNVGNLDDEYLLNNNKLNNFKNFTGTSIQNNLQVGYISDNQEEDLESISSEDQNSLILNQDEDEDEVKVFNQNYIYNPNYETAFFDYEDDECNEVIDADKEEERRELRLQILKELY